MSENHPTDTVAFFDDTELEQMATRLRNMVDIRDRKHGFPPKTFEKCFVGSQAVEKMVQENIATDADDAVRIGNMLLNAGVFHHVQHAHAFKNQKLFYRFAADEDHGRPGRVPDGSSVSWAEFMAPLAAEQGRTLKLQPDVPEQDPNLAECDQDDLDKIDIAPLDEHNTALLDNVRPKAWEDPTPKSKYNLVVIGAGTGGLVSAAAAAGLGGRVALIEAHMFGGDCLNVGCVPSKALLRCARAAHSVRNSGNFGIAINGEVSVDFGYVMERMRRLRAQIAPVDSAQRYARKLGVDVFLGRARFTGKDTVEVNGQTLNFAKAVVATGGTAAIPNIPGLKDAPYLTNATIFNLTHLPPRLGVIGAGPIGLELAQAFQRFGSQVTVFSRSNRILPKEDPDAAALVLESLRRDGVTVMFNVNYRSVGHSDGSAPLTMELDINGEPRTMELDALLVAAGRKPSVNGLGLERAGVDFDPRKGIETNDRLQTSNPSIYAVGDVAGKYQFTHMADFMARLVIRNALFFGRDNFSDLLVPWATYTEPEVAHVGLYEKDLQDRNQAYVTITQPFEDVDRSILEGDVEGFVKIHVKKGSDQILGATIVGSHAGDLISEITVAMQSGMGLGKLASVIHPYPTVAEAIRKCGDTYNRNRLTPTVKSIFYRLMALQR